MSTDPNASQSRATSPSARLAALVVDSFEEMSAPERQNLVAKLQVGLLESDTGAELAARSLNGFRVGLKEALGATHLTIVRPADIGTSRTAREQLEGVPGPSTRATRADRKKSGRKKTEAATYEQHVLDAIRRTGKPDPTQDDVGSQMAPPVKGKSLSDRLSLLGLDWPELLARGTRPT